MKLLQTISRIFTGAVFVFSGLVKAIDPFGSAIKFEEYFEAFQIGFLAHLSLPLAILLSAIEMMIGINLLACIRMRITSWILLVFMSFFTILTFILALNNPVSDCGCFGDAIKLTNWQTFWKNIVIFIPTLIIFTRRNDFIAFLKPAFEWTMAGFGLMTPIMLSVYCIIHLPLLDFRAYKIGTNIPEDMKIPEGAPVDEYETILVYEKAGVIEEFTVKDYPWDDSTWIWVETRQKLIKKGDTPPIYDFSITSSEGMDITENVLSDPDYTILFIAPELDKANRKGMQLSNELAIHCAELGINFICLTSSSDHQAESFKNNFKPVYDLYTGDETTLKTIIRANPGLVLLKEGTILGKWNFRDAPRYEELKSDMLSVALTMQRHQFEHLRVWAILLSLCIVYGLLMLFFSKIQVFKNPGIQYNDSAQ